jgi:simple sugar transport system ATP-binding protein
LRRLNVKGAPEQPIHSLSGGNQQRVLLARWLAQEPKILILNGPSVGVDVGSKADIHQIISEFAETGMATLLISDDLSELVSCCNRVLVMNRGKIAQEIDGAHLSETRLAQAIAG